MAKGNKTGKKGIKNLVIFSILILIICLGIFIFNNMKKNNNVSSNAAIQIDEATKERIEKIKETAKKREEEIKNINSGNKNIEEYKYLKSEDFIKYLTEENLFDSSNGDEFIGGVIRIYGNTIEIKNYINENNIATEFIEDSVSSGKPQIIFTDKLEFDNDGNAVVKLDENDKPLFDGKTNTKEDIVVVLDKEDRMLNDKLNVSYSTPIENWKNGETYEVKYSVKDSNNNEATHTLKVKVSK